MALTATTSGARSIFGMLIGNRYQLMAYAGGVNVGEEIAYEPVEVLDLLEVKEWVPTAYRTTIGCNVFRTFGDLDGQGSLKKQKLFPRQSQILFADDMVAVITDRGTQKTLAKVEGVKISSWSASITARGLVAMDVAMVSIRAKDEEEVP